jgi:hypothetical protein
MTMTTTGSRLEHPIGADGLFSLHLRSGDVRLRGVDGDTIVVLDRRGRDLGAAFELALGEGSFSLREHRGVSVFHGGGGDLEIALPRHATIVVETSSGDLEIEGLTGDQHYRMASGDLRMRGVAGGIVVQGVSGDVNVVAAADADVTLTTVSGDVELRAGTLRSLSLATTSGDAKVAGRLAGPGPFSIETVSGDVLLAAAGDLRVEMRTVSGDLSSDVGGRIESGRGRRSVSIGSGGPTLAVRSMSGDVTVVRPVALTADLEPANAASTIEAVESDDEDAAELPKPANGAIAAAYDDARLRILRSLERGEIDVTEAGGRLEALDDGSDEADATTEPIAVAPPDDEAADAEAIHEDDPDADADTARFSADESSRG